MTLASRMNIHAIVHTSAHRIAAAVGTAAARHHAAIPATAMVSDRDSLRIWVFHSAKRGWIARATNPITAAAAATRDFSTRTAVVHNARNAAMYASDWARVARVMLRANAHRKRG